ncbi:MAG: cell division protein FtsK [Bacteroidetes bacterium GWA2_31_9]|nr:MAG: cell division protein FtsK [Bacteroidetes bacterium GWA2_31_9]
MKAFFNFFKDERIKFLTGLAFLLISVFFALAFISYMFTWKVDKSMLDMKASDFFFRADIIVDNWAGKAGAIVANKFINNWFGLSSFLFIFIFFINGFKLLNVRLMNVQRAVWNTLFLILWSSILFGLTFSDKYFVLGGLHGLYMSKWLSSMFGHGGTIITLTIALLTFVLFRFDGSLQKIKEYILKLSQLFSKPENIDQVKESETVIIDEKSNDENVVDLISEDKDVENDDIEEDEVDEEEDEIEEELDDENEEYDFNKPIQLDNNIDSIKSGKNEEFEFTVEKKIDEVLIDENQSLSPTGDYDPTLDLSNYKFPPIDLLEDHKSSNSEVSEQELNENKNKILETLRNYKIEIDKIKATIGPTVTLYEIVPAPGIRISKIKNLEDDIALSLSALGIRIIAPIPGKGTIGIEVPNQNPEVVSMRSVIGSKKFQECNFELPVVLGKTITNETYMFDLTKMPHLLVAGATGQGKSVGLNAILASLLYKKHPSQLKFVMVDPKKVELTLYSKIEKHFLAKIPDADDAIITDNQKVVATLNSLTVEMDNRYDLLKKAQVRNIVEYNDKFVKRNLNPNNGHKFLPYIVVVIDEFADLIMTAGKEVETPIARIAQLARAVGIHLIIATQRPSVNIITGIIKANFPARIAFRVSSLIDSRTILDSPGANQLIGRGDMLMSQGSTMTRIQCAFIDTKEIDDVTEFISNQQSYSSAFLLPEFVPEGEASSLDIDLSKRDDLFDDAARLVVTNQQGSTSLIQRKFSIGYNRAGRIIDQLEAAGIVGPYEGSKARQVSYTDLNSLEQYLNTLGN